CRAALHSPPINEGARRRTDRNAPFLPGAPAKPAGANYYPDGASKAALERWIQSLPAADRERPNAFFTVVRRSGNGFTLVPYSLEYQPELSRVAVLLREGAQNETQPTAKKFLPRP